MNQTERVHLLNQMLLEEMPRLKRDAESFPPDTNSQKRLLRSLLNVRPPVPVKPEFLRIQDAYLQQERDKKGVTHVANLEPIQEQLYLWRGDITTLDADAIVNAANSALLGCFVPCHACIDNCIHTFSGVQLRLKCDELMKQQGYEEPTGKAKITPAYNLPCKYVLHTVGPIIAGPLRERDCQMLASCYRSCLELAQGNGLHSVAFCCISTGEFHFPNQRAAEIAVTTVQDYLRETNSDMKVIFNVFKEKDDAIYRELLGGTGAAAQGAGGL